MNELSKIIDKVDNMINELNDIKTELLQINCYGKPLKWAEIRADYFDEDKLSFRIMAILNSDNENVSPRISSFRITGR